MNDIFAISDILTSERSELDILPTLFSFFVCVIMSFVIRSFYIYRSFSLTGKMHIGSILPVLSAVTFTVIVVVKSSLALSLGLVGALSIVRFRTPIKEPEELVYLFMAISIGLGYGAGHIMITTLLTTCTLFIVYFWLSNLKNGNTSEYNVVVNWAKKTLSFEKLVEIIAETSESLKLIRLENGSSGNTAVFLVTPNEDMDFDSFVNKIKEHDSELSITFFEAKTNW